MARGVEVKMTLTVKDVDRYNAFDYTVLFRCFGQESEVASKSCLEIIQSSMSVK